MIESNTDTDLIVNALGDNGKFYTKYINNTLAGDFKYELVTLLKAQQEKIGKLESALSQLIDKDTIDPVTSWALGNICTNSSPDTNGRAIRMDQFKVFTDAVEVAEKLINKELVK